MYNKYNILKYLGCRVRSSVDIKHVLHISKTIWKINIEISATKQASLGIKRKSQQGQTVMCALTMFSAIMGME